MFKKDVFVTGARHCITQRNSASALFSNFYYLGVCPPVVPGVTAKGA